MAILSFRFVLVAFLAYFLRTEIKWALLSLFLKVLGGGSKEADGEEADGKVVDGKVAYGKDISSEKAVSKKVRGFSADFTLYIFWLFTKSYKERFSIYFLKLH
jgi:hypothetical protein